MNRLTQLLITFVAAAIGAIIGSYLTARDMRWRTLTDGHGVNHIAPEQNHWGKK